MPNQPRHHIAATLDSAKLEGPRLGRSRCAVALGLNPGLTHGGCS